MSDSNGSEDPTVEFAASEPSENRTASGNIGQTLQMRQHRSPWSIVKSFFFRILMIYLVTRFIRRPTNPNPLVNETHSVNPHRSYKLKNLYMPGDLLDLHIFINDEKLYRYDASAEPIWRFDRFRYADWTSEGMSSKLVEFSLSQAMKTNGSIHIHVVVTKHGHSIDPNLTDGQSPQFTFWKSKRLNRFKRKTKLNEEIPTEIFSHWHENLTIDLVDDQASWRRGHVPSPMDRYLQYESQTGKYYPILYLNNYWNLLVDYQPINATVEKLKLRITIEPLQLWKWQLYISQNVRQNWLTNLFSDDQTESDQEAFKRVFLQTNPFLLVMTIGISLFHFIFEVLAFKNDIEFWRTRKSLNGLSVRSLIFQIFQSFVVFLYVLEQQANAIVRLSVFIGIFIELWKLPKILQFERVNDEKWFRFVPKYKLINEKTETSEFDRVAFKYLSWILFPFLLSYASYLWIYVEQTSCYSFCVSTIYGCCLTFGFIMMTPQLFINYKLKSVAHLPWRMLTYKALNTFIDDLFAFVLKMPTIYRFACFRDDLIFLIYLYQRYIYPVDQHR